MSADPARLTFTYSVVGPAFTSILTFTTLRAILAIETLWTGYRTIRTSPSRITFTNACSNENFVYVINNIAENFGTYRRNSVKLQTGNVVTIATILAETALSTVLTVSLERTWMFAHRTNETRSTFEFSGNVIASLIIVYGANKQNF